MATPAQVMGNQANAQHSTGPSTAEGKARSSRNNLQHGLTLAVLTLSPEEQARFCEFEANLRAECRPEGVLECEALQQFLDAVAEMTAYHALKALRELQTARLFRAFHVTPEEREAIPPLVNPGENFWCGGEMRYGRNARTLLSHLRRRNANLPFPAARRRPWRPRVLRIQTHFAA